MSITQRGAALTGARQEHYGTLTEETSVTVTIRRTPPQPEHVTYEVPFTPGMSVFNVLETIRDTLDPSLAIPISCRIGKCDICFIKVNGKVRWACTEPPVEEMLLEPIDRYVILKDLVVDLDRRITTKGDATMAAGEAE